MMPAAYERRTCRVCGSTDLDSILDFGSIVLSDFPDPQDPDPPSVPLDLVQCLGCDLVQLRHTPNPDRLYVQQPYWYRSSVNETMVAELRHVVLSAVNMVEPSVVVDVGANDGTLLQHYPPSLTRIAFEPSLQFHDRLHESANLVISDFFPQGLKEAGLPSKSVSILSAVACFYDLDCPQVFIDAVDHLLTDDGVCILQFQDLAGMIQATGYDNICHEHLVYYTLADLHRLLEDYDLHVTAVERRAINGGSLRAYIRRAHQDQQPSVLKASIWEQQYTGPQALAEFTQRTTIAQQQLRGLVHKLVDRGQPVDLYAASTKSSVLLQTCGLGHQEIRQAVERSPEKYGKETSGTRIPIVPESVWREDPAPYTLIGAWGFRDAFVQREADYLVRGGSFIVPIPSVEIVQGARA